MVVIVSLSDTFNQTKDETMNDTATTERGEAIEELAFGSVATIVFRNIARNDTVVWVAADADAFRRSVARLEADNNCEILQAGPSHIAR